jgi:hypothetical protein
MRFCVSGDKWGPSGDKWGPSGDKWGRHVDIDGGKMSTINVHMTKTTEVAEDRAYDDTKSVLPAEFARAKHLGIESTTHTYINHAPSAQALKIMHLMIAVAGGCMADDVAHEIKGSDIRQIKGMRKHDKASLAPLIAEIRATTIVYDDTLTEQMTIGGFLDTAKVDYRYDDHGDIKVRWWFSRSFRETAANSTHWAIMDRQTVFALRSKYSIQLYQYIASLVGLRHKNSQRFLITELRSILGVQEGKLSRFADFNKRAILPSIAEINQLSRFDLSTRTIMNGRYISAVEISWEEKPDPTRAKNELDRPKAGRKARRDGTAETPVTAFPDFGSVKGTQPWDRIARDNAPRIDGRHVPDLRVLADTFRKWCGEKSIPLDMRNIEKTFTTWCKSYSAR